MRILNRPMFKYGGPIKEGVMHGMRNGGRTLAGGNQMGTPMGNRTGFATPWDWKKKIAMKIPAMGNIYQRGLANWGKIFNKAIPVVKGIPKNLQGVFTRTGTSPGITGTGAGSAWMTGPSKYLSHLKKVAPMAKNLWGKHRYKTIAGGLGLTSAPAIGTYKWLADKAPGAIKGVTPDWIENLFTGKEKIDEKDGTDTITEKIAAIGPGAQFKEDTAPILTDTMRADLAKKQQNERLKKYLDMMGYDSAKKTAMSDALIDASALVQDATTEAGSLKKADWGSLINKAIQTTSRRLDKPAQIREAVGLMMTKGAIEKDILEGKGGALKQNAKDLVSAGVYKTEKEALEHLSKKAGFEEVVGALSAKKDVTGKVLADAWRISGEGIPTESFRGSDDVYKNFKEKKEDENKGTNIELAFVEEKIDDKKPGDVFIVDDRMVIVNADGTVKYRW